MFYKQRKMEAENQQFFHRIGQLPVVKAVSEQAVSVYEVAKNSNRLFNATFQLAENSVKYATEVGAVKKILDSRIVAKANKIAVTGLDKVEHNYPIVQKTPKELWDVGKGYYDHSFLKTNVDRVYSVKEYGVTKVSNTKKYYRDLINDTLNRLLELSDSVVDNYIAVQTDSNGQWQCNANDSYYVRVQCISGKAYRGLKYRAGQKYTVTKEYALQTVGNFRMVTFLIEYAKSTAGWTNQKTQATLTAAQEQAKALWHEIQRRTDSVTGRSGAVILNLVQGLTSNLATLSQQVAKYSSPYLPQIVEKPVAAGAAYAQELRDSFAKAKTLGELRTEVVTEARQKLAYVQDGLTKGIDYVVEFPPICWLIPGSRQLTSNTDKDDKENGHIANDRKNGGH